MNELKDKFEFIERIADLKTHEDFESSEVLFVGEKSKKIMAKTIINKTFFDLKRKLTGLTKSQIELQFDSIDFSKVEDLEESSRKLHEIIKNIMGVFKVKETNFFVEVKLDHDLEVFVSGESESGPREIKDLKNYIPINESLQVRSKTTGENGFWNSFVLKCELVNMIETMESKPVETTLSKDEIRKHDNNKVSNIRNIEA